MFPNPVVKIAVQCSMTVEIHQSTLEVKVARRSLILSQTGTCYVIQQNKFKICLKRLRIVVYTGSFKVHGFSTKKMRNDVDQFCYSVDRILWRSKDERLLTQ